MDGAVSHVLLGLSGTVHEGTKASANDPLGAGVIQGLLGLDPGCHSCSTKIAKLGSLPNPEKTLPSVEAPVQPHTLASAIAVQYWLWQVLLQRASEVT